MSKVVTTISIRRDLKDEGIKAAKEGRFAGISDFSSLIELALDKLLHPEKYQEEKA